MEKIKRRSVLTPFGAFLLSLVPEILEVEMLNKRYKGNKQSLEAHIEEGTSGFITDRIILVEQEAGLVWDKLLPLPWLLAFKRKKIPLDVFIKNIRDLLEEHGGIIPNC